MNLITERLSISNLCLEDSDFILKLLNSSGWLRFIGQRNVKSYNQAKLYIASILKSTDVNYWVVRLKATKQTMGIITFIKKEYLPYPDIGFAFLPEFENKGLAEEATTCILNQLTLENQFSHILGVTIKSNYKAIKLLNKLGFLYSHDLIVNKENLQVYKTSRDTILLNKLTKNFFSVFNNVDMKKVNLNQLKSFCSPEISIFKCRNDSYTSTNLFDFIKERQELLTNGTLINFNEKEIHRKSIIQGNIALRYSEYEKSGELLNHRFVQRGYKMFQFVKSKNKWKICSIIWEDLNPIN